MRELGLIKHSKCLFTALGTKTKKHLCVCMARLRHHGIITNDGRNFHEILHVTSSWEDCSG